MSQTRYSGRTAAEAAIRACERLGLTRSELTYELVEDVGEGLDRRVTIEVQNAPQRTEAAAEPAAEAPRRSERRERPKTPAAQAIDDEDDDEEPPRRDELPNEVRQSSGRGGQRGRGRSGGGGNGGNDRAERGDRGGRNRSGGGRGQGRNGEGQRGRGRDEAPRERSSREAPRRRQSARSGPGLDALLELREPSAVPTPLEAITPQSPRSTAALRVVKELVECMDLAVDVKLVREDEAEIHVHVTGQDEKTVIGQRGEVLLALQFLANRLLGRAEQEDEADQVLVLDAGGHRQRRHAAITSLAQALAERALQENKAVRLSPMSAHDRRIFHVALKDMEGITTQSEGDGMLRNLLIVPAALVEG